LQQRAAEAVTSAHLAVGLIMRRPDVGARLEVELKTMPEQAYTSLSGV
jgi:hypothetical protein